MLDTSSLSPPESYSEKETNTWEVARKGENREDMGGEGRRGRGGEEREMERGGRERERGEKWKGERRGGEGEKKRRRDRKIARGRMVRRGGGCGQDKQEETERLTFLAFSPQYNPSKV